MIHLPGGTRKISWEWLGSFFDGEGDFGISFSEKIRYGKPYIVVKARISQRDRSLLERIKKFLVKEGFKANITKKGDDLSVTGKQNTHKFIKKLFPFLNKTQKNTKSQKINGNNRTL